MSDQQRSIAKKRKAILRTGKKQKLTTPCQLDAAQRGACTICGFPEPSLHEDSAVEAAGCPCSIRRCRHDSMGRIIAFIARKMRAHLVDRLAPFDLGAGQYPFVIALLRRGSCSQDRLAELTAMDKSTTARALRALEQKGFITRTPVPQNRRMNMVHPTAKAEALKNELELQLDTLNQELTKGLTVAEQRLLRNMLHKLELNADNLKTI